MGLARDIWRVGVAQAPIAEIWRTGAIDPATVRMLPEEGFMRFLADPFAFVHQGVTHLFAERYDYRTRHGVIDWLRLDGARREVLAEPWHLSYPFVFEGEGAIWMLPEASRMGGLTLYRAAEFPYRWERAAPIALDVVPVDATPVFHDGLWWLFHSPRGHHALHVAWAERLAGPWYPHPRNPLRTGAEGSRPGGTPALLDGRLILPVQDCVGTYGRRVRPLRIARLTTEAFEGELGEPLAIPAALAPYGDGMHTLSAAGDVTLFDVKRIELSTRSLGVLGWRAIRGLAAGR